MKEYFSNCNILFISLLFVSSLAVTSCEDYLDAAPEAEIAEVDIFGTFQRYQGFVEDIYQCIPDYTRAKYNFANWNFSNDVIHFGNQTMSYGFERGNYWMWTNQVYSPFNGTINERKNNQGNEAGTENFKSGFWRTGWLAIRKANMAIENINMLEGSDEERNLILGQAYFFRAFFHFHILAAWGGVPYIDKVFTAEDKLDWPRLSYLETALRIAEDLEKAVDLLPKTWGETEAGQATLGANGGRVTKGAALGYLGKNWLYAASPLMNGMETGDYTSYNAEYAKKAAEAFDKLLKLAEEGYYGLHSWENYRLNFWTMTTESLTGKEWVWSNPNYRASRNSHGEHLYTHFGGQANGYASPTLELVNKFGMKNGLPITESDSEYNPEDPWADRDPRFYYSFVLDGEKILHYTTNYPDHTYAHLYVGGRHRVNNARTGFGQKKFLGPGANNKDNKWGNNYYMNVPYMRLAHIYLMYAEAANEGYGGPDGKSPDGMMTAKEAVNFVRNRANVPPVDARFLISKDVFRNTIRQEIGTELCLEGHQWYDYRRWYVAHLPENRTKTRLDFDAGHTYYTPVQMAEILFDPGKHYWLPFQRNEAALYPEFYQNPGW